MNEKFSVANIITIAVCLISLAYGYGMLGNRVAHNEVETKKIGLQLDANTKDHINFVRYRDLADFKEDVRGDIQSLTEEIRELRKELSKK